MTSAALGPAGQRPLAGSSVPVRPADRIREAARSERYWVLAPERGDVWSLRRLDDTTGHLGDAEHSERFGGDDVAATVWASKLLGVDGWQSLGMLAGAYIEEAYSVVRSIAHYPRAGRTVVVRVEPDQHDPGLTLATVRERWDATGQVSDPLYTYDRSSFAGDEELLAEVSKAYGLTGRWLPDADGGWRHQEA